MSIPTKKYCFLKCVVDPGDYFFYTLEFGLKAFVGGSSACFSQQVKTPIWVSDPRLTTSKQSNPQQLAGRGKSTIAPKQKGVIPIYLHMFHEFWNRAYCGEDSIFQHFSEARCYQCQQCVHEVLGILDLNEQSWGPWKLLWKNLKVVSILDVTTFPPLYGKVGCVLHGIGFSDQSASVITFCPSICLLRV